MTYEISMVNIWWANCVLNLCGDIWGIVTFYYIIYGDICGAYFI
jgi:hypothetical protein